MGTDEHGLGKGLGRELHEFSRIETKTSWAASAEQRGDGAFERT
jgi:hypothetical protein